MSLLSADRVWKKICLSLVQGQYPYSDMEEILLDWLDNYIQAYKPDGLAVKSPKNLTQLHLSNYLFEQAIS